MKKVFLTLALAAFAMAGNAQLVLGGQLGFESKGGNTNVAHTGNTAATSYEFDVNGMNQQNYNSLTILPKVGYQLNDKMQVGASFGIEWTKTKDFSRYNTILAQYPDFEGWESTTRTNFTIAPYFRYNVTEMGKFTVFCEAQLPIGISPNNKVHVYESEYTDAFGINHDKVDKDIEYPLNKSFSMGITIVPGLNYKFSDKFSADLYIDLLGLSYMHKSETYQDDDQVPYTVTTRSSNEFNCLVNLNAQDLNSHLRMFRLGFNYHF